MALTFGAASSNRVDCGSAAALDDMAAVTVLAWVYCTTRTSSRTIISKFRGSLGSGWRLSLQGTSGDVQFEWARATTYALGLTNTAPVVTNSWVFLAASCDKSTAPKIYEGTLTSLAVESTYTTSRAGAGAFGSDAARYLALGNADNAATPTLAFQGRISHAAVFDSVLSLDEIQSWQNNPRPLIGAKAALGEWNLGLDPIGTGTQPDLSGNGNDGTVTGATVSVHTPLARLYDHLNPVTRRRVALRR